jgi:hypothetical protein
MLIFKDGFNTFKAVLELCGGFEAFRKFANLEDLFVKIG